MAKRMTRRDFSDKALKTGGGLLLRASPVGEAGADAPPRGTINWPGFLAQQDPVWERLPANWWEAPFLGNGLMGTMVRQIAPQTIRFDIDRADVQEHRKVETGETGGAPGANGFDAVWARSRLPIGYFTLRLLYPGDGRNDYGRNAAFGPLECRTAR